MTSPYRQLAQSNNPAVTTRKRPCSRACCCLIFVMISAVLLAFSVIALWQVGVFMYPLHAQCSIEWKFNAPCNEVSQKLIDQMKKWESDENCKNGGQKCLYKYLSFVGKELKGTHETPVKHYVDDLTFTFKTDPPTQPTCAAKGYSRSQTWYAVLDYGTNYCNLRNLIEGAGLTNDPEFTEKTSNSICTQYTSRNCEKY